MSTPEFMQACRHYLTLSERYGDDHPATEKAFSHLLDLTPPELIEEFYGEALAAMPKPQGYTRSGDPVYTAQSIAEHFGLSEEEVERGLEKVGANLVNPADVQRVQ